MPAALLEPDADAAYPMTSPARSPGSSGEAFSLGCGPPAGLDCGQDSPGSHRDRAEQLLKLEAYIAKESVRADLSWLDRDHLCRMQARCQQWREQQRQAKKRSRTSATAACAWDKRKLQKPGLAFRPQGRNCVVGRTVRSLQVMCHFWQTHAMLPLHESCLTSSCWQERNI